MNTTLMILGAFIALESINAMRLFDGTSHKLFIRFFTSLKYTCTGSAGFILAWQAHEGYADWKLVLCAASIALLIISKAVCRWINELRDHYPFIYIMLVRKFGVISRINYDSIGKSN